MKISKIVKTDLPCFICGFPTATMGGALNGLPDSVPACQECRDAVRRREVGVSIKRDGAISVIDGRKPYVPTVCNMVYQIYACRLPHGHDGTHEAINQQTGEVLAMWDESESRVWPLTLDTKE